jgi:hypothetical protein
MLLARHVLCNSSRVADWRDLRIRGRRSK